MAKKGGSFWDNPFGGLFDFNRDGKEDFGEQWLAFKIFEECTKETKPDHSDYAYSPHYDYYSWRHHCEDGSEYGVDPFDYETEEEYERAVKKAKYAWRDTCEDGFQYGIHPQDYETEEAYLSALEDAKYGWRITCEDGSDVGIDPDDYEDEDEYNEALEEARGAWRLTCEDGSDVDVDPYDYETEEDYNEALETARQSLGEQAGEHDSIHMVGLPDDMEDDDPIPNEKDYLYKRMYDAALELSTMNSFPDLYADKEAKKRRFICERILERKEFPFKYLTLDSGFLLVQAVKENFDLPCTFPDEDESPKTWLEDLIKRVARRDARLAVDIWAWCIKEFTPFLEYSPYESIIHNDVLGSVSGYGKKFFDAFIDRLGDDDEFLQVLYRDNPEVPCCAETIISAALERNAIQVAAAVFQAALQNEKTDASEIESLVDECISGCFNWTELETMEAFQTHHYPLLEKESSREIRALFPEWEEKMQEYIDEVEKNSEKYAYSRRNAWRSKYKSVTGSYVDVLDYDNEEEYLAAVNEEKYGWRTWRQQDSERHNVPLDQFETEEEFVQEIQRVIAEKSAERQKQAQAKRDQDRAQRAMARRSPVDPLAQTDKNVYGFCAVVFESSSQPYSYLTGSIEVDVGDKVIVPVGQDQKEVEATVVSIGKYMRVSAPYPVDKASTIIRKLSTNE